MSTGRQPKESYLMSIAHQVASRSTCDRATVGCVVTQDGHIVSTGYNGALPKQGHCSQVRHLLVNGHCVRTVHAEQNAIGWCANRGIATLGAHIYCTHFPCLTCAKLIITAGIVRVVYDQDYNVDPAAMDFFRHAKVIVDRIECM